ncbi:MAG TPA: sensor histidine kinase, partial [bacterium]|nr:sensor histidine kinase [bacterium]
RIAREIHDSLGQQLTALQLEVTAATHALKGGVEVPKALQDAVHTIEESITMAQNLCYDLRPPLLDDFGLEAALRDHVTEYQEKWGIAVDFTAEKLDHLLSRDAETALFRVAQEAMNNVLKHAQARMVRVRLGLYDGRIFLRIQDDGCGFEPEPVQSRGRSDHFGLMTMNERIELLGGELMVESRPGSGATITAWLPMQRREER